MATALKLTDLDHTASDILAGRFTHSSYFDDNEWRTAAECHVEGDSSDLEYMLEREAAMDAFEDWSYRGQFISAREGERREFTDFEDWFGGRAAA